MTKQTFAELGVSSAVSAALARRGVTAPFPVQRLVLEDALAGRDVLVKSPTGSGKTLAFGIPLVELVERGEAGPVALILAPTRELAAQILDAIKDLAAARGLRATAVYGGVGVAAQAARAAKAQILVATPGRLEDLMQRRAFTLDTVRIFVLDEADRMLDMGFRPAIDRIVKACPAARQTLFFSATLDGIAGQVASQYTRHAVTHETGTGGTATGTKVEHRFVTVEGEGRLDALFTELGRERDRTLVFVRTKRGADRLVKHLRAGGVTALAIHGDKSQRQREQALSRFQSGDVDTLIATDVAARGIDVHGISHVINFHPPESHEAYIHRIGRTGRAGRRGVGITLVGDEDRQEMSRLAGRLGLRRELGGVAERQPRPARAVSSAASRRARTHRGRRSQGRAA